MKAMLALLNKYIYRILVAQKRYTVVKDTYNIYRIDLCTKIHRSIYYKHLGFTIYMLKL